MSAPGSRSRTFVYDTAVATVAIGVLYGLSAGVQFQPVQIPGYLLIVGFDVIEGLFGSAGNYYDLLFAVYILGLGVVGGVVAGVLRSRSLDDGDGWRSGTAGALSVVGGLSVLFAVSILLRGAQLIPALVGAAAGVVMLALAGRLLGLFGPRGGS